MSALSHLFDITGRTAVVTGGAGLLGKQFCTTLADAGASVLIADIDGEAADRLANSFTKSGYSSIGCEMDVTSPVSVSRMVEKTIDAYGGVDILVNSAALDPKIDPNSRFSNSGSFEETSLDVWQQALDVNLTGAMLCCRAVLKAMVERKSGVIINIASIYGLVAPDQRLYSQAGKPPQYKPAYYSVTKAGILGLTKYLASYYGDKNIRVNALTPGGVFNEQGDDFVRRYSTRTVLGRMADLDDMNGALLFLASDASRYMTGANLIVDGGWTAW
jgi:NAD(P)-dependent dehydrogenase (short-subunit alcohol dehydrogenase family)